MKSKSRTSYSINNIISTFIPYVIIGVLGFVKIKVFVTNLSNDVVSLNQLFYQLLGYLALAEAGFGVFTIQKYYKAFAKNDYEKINEIYSTSKIYFKNVGLLILGLAAILSFFVTFLTKANLSNVYIQVIFLIFIIKNSVDYFMMCPRFVIQADQKMYKVNYLINLIKISESVIEIILVILGFNYIVILIPGIFIRIILNILINKLVYKEYPWLKSDNKFYKEDIKGMGDVVTQKIVGIFYSNTDIILISSFINPISVVIYTSYNYIIKFIFDVIYMAAQALAPSYANVLNKEKLSKKLSVFSELNIIFYWLASFFTILLSIVLTPLIKIWVGSEYIISNFTLYLFLGVMFIDIARRMMYIIINAEGFFKETKNIIILEAVLNFIISITLINKFGIKGLLIGTISSMILTTFWFFPKLIFKKVFEKDSLKYFFDYIIVLTITIMTVLVINNLYILNANNYLIWFIKSAGIAIILGIILVLIFYIIFKQFRALISRMLFIIKKILKKEIKE